VERSPVAWTMVEVWRERDGYDGREEEE